MKVGIFYNSITNLSKFSNKVMLMDIFREGVQAMGDVPVEFRFNILPDQPLDAAFILGYTLEENFRKKIIDRLREQNVPTIFVDSNILHYARPEHQWHRYSIGSVYPDTGVYFFKDYDPKKWDNFSSWHGVELKPWRTHGEHILLLAQRPKGFNMFTNQDLWIVNTINEIRKYSGRPIMVRFHPGDSTRLKQMDKIRKRYGGSVDVSEHENIKDALKNCWCSVGYASTPNVVSAIEGIPVYVEEPDKSWAKQVCFTDLSQIENPPMPDRETWKHRIAAIHWSNYEVQSGQLWAAIKKYISSVR